MRKLLILFLLATTAAFGQAPTNSSTQITGSTAFTPNGWRYKDSTQVQAYNTTLAKYFQLVTGKQFNNYIGTATQTELGRKLDSAINKPLINKINGKADSARLYGTVLPTLDASVVHKTGNETISDTKTFTNYPLSVTPLSTDRSKKIATMEAVYSLSKALTDSAGSVNTTQLFTASPTSGTTVTVAPNATILSVTRSGSAYYYANNSSPTGNAFYYDGSAGTVKFQDAFVSTGENIAVLYRGSRTIAGTVYYGPSSAIPTTVGDLSSLTSASLSTTFISNTGTTYRYFNLIMNQAYSISNVTDLDAGAFGDITANYIFRGTIVISGTTYNVYTMIVGAAQSSNHRHQFTIN